MAVVPPAFLAGAEPGFPVIARLDTADVVFKQYLADVESARRRLFTREQTGDTAESLTEALTVYTYTAAKGDDLLSLAARCNIPYASLATLNRIVHSGSLETQGDLLLPSMPGLFIPEEPRSDLEQLLQSSRQDQGIIITINRQGGAERFRFIPGEDFSTTERAFFLNNNFRFPLRSYRLTSPFGLRISPITGSLRNHDGLDLAAPLGTEVYAAREGVVTELGEDPVYGNYIIIQHDGNWASLYGHLSSILVELQRRVSSGALIGRVGSTGMSTGPHLHFELRQHGQAQDPGKLLNGTF